MNRAKRWALRLDSVFEYLQLTFFALMVLIVTWQVFSRYVLGSTPRWSVESSTILMIWVGFMGIAIGFRERIHIALDILVRRLPQTAQKWVQKGIYLLTFLFGVYLLFYGWEFVQQTRLSTLPGTELPRSSLYLMLPVAGLMICIYTALQILGIQTQRHTQSFDEENSAIGSD